MIYTESPRRKQINKHVSWGHWFAFANIFIAIGISSIYLFSTPIADTPISFLYLITTWLGHTSFIAFLGFIILVLPLCYKVTSMRVLRAGASTISALGLALLAFDALVYNKTGFHISFSSAELLRSETQVQVSAFGWLQWFYLILLFIIWLMLQLVMANAIYNRLSRIRNFKFTPYLSTFLVLCFVSSHGIHVWADARLYTPVLKQDNMFPLSYPATAKTLMARYGLLDLEMREQQEELQYQVGSGFVYPPKPVYCSVNSGIKMVILSALEASNYSQLDALNSNDYHLVPQHNASSFMRKLAYGIPNNMARLTSVPPVMTDLLNAFDVPNTTYQYNSESAAENATQQKFDFSGFKESIERNDSGLFIGLLNAEQLESIDIPSLGDNIALMVIAKQNNAPHFKLYSNFLDTKQASSNEDIPPTVLQHFGCLAEVERFSTGQALQSPSRNWLVSTNGENLVIFKYPLLTEVSRDGSYKVFDVNLQKEILIDIDTNMLSRSIKHLEKFTQK
ncbi:DUF3413 domain-containing protein [Agaribacter marinus]|uniref:Inner membrane protein YejM N-terminal domain-containing protein n=1 Tax=Agaribacter marinus TaxID=1431249 RepID=A0AA37SYV1_9ALTE|nr:DUF3413 domain-containing protein [Agaribacter marinus]GLR70346.1 hypothetical protein GCM10007852_12540 [Agaribacter marinus]